MLTMISSAYSFLTTLSHKFEYDKLQFSNNLHETFGFQLIDPGLGTPFRFIILVIFIEHGTDELSITLSFGSLVVVSFGGSETKHLASLCFK
mmetsp:Transcript_26476/g.60989  ORF Transcript_26476/g.60989 Transcript_26476/m.60989 type:complete len:92 (+) Transcript_26476:141-416(+)